MKLAAALHLFFVTCLCTCVHAELHGSQGLQDLLNPVSNLQITLRIPDTPYSKLPWLPPVFIKAIYFLTAVQVPFRLFYNFTGKRTLVSRSTARHTRNEVLCLVFVRVQRKSQAINLGDVFRSCSLGAARVSSFKSVAHNDFFQLLVDETAGHAPEIYWSGMERTYIPLHFTILVWSGTRFTSPDAVLAPTTCLQGTVVCSAFSLINNYILKLKQPNGFDRVLKEIRIQKSNFAGLRILVVPSRPLGSFTWESAWRNVYSQISLRLAQQHWKYAYFGVLGLFGGNLELV